MSVPPSGRLTDASRDRSPRRVDPARERPRGLRERLEEIERQEILRALDAADADVSAAAELGIGRSTLYRRMIELGIERTV